MLDTPESAPASPRATADPPVAGSTAAKIDRLARLIAEARRTGHRLAGLPAGLLPADAAEADATQEATAAVLGLTIGGYKVAQRGDAPGDWGAIPASRILAAPARLTAPRGGLRIEIEIAFRLGRDLPGRGDGRAYGADEVADAVAEAVAAFELIESRLPAEPKPSPLAARADMMGNWGLVVGAPVVDWRSAAGTDVAVRLEIDGRAVVDQRGGHPSGRPDHPLVWLANALAARGRGLTAGQIVTTGAFGGSHPLPPGATVAGRVAGFPPLGLEVLP
jgi:2-keto-4-pentenoate hydratase